MKKIFFLVVAIYVLSFISFKDPNKDLQSFSGIIKKDPTKIKELLAVADSLRSFHSKNESIDTADIKTAEQLSEFRKNDRKGFILKKENYPVIKVSVLDMIQIINRETSSPEITDSLVFYLGKYRNTGSDWIGRYNQRNHLISSNRVEFKHLLDRPGFLIEVNRQRTTLLSSRYYDIQRICPPPSDAGCD
jgi:hypothetical protein